MEDKPYTTIMVYKEDRAALDELMKDGRFKKRQDAFAYLIKFAKEHGEM